MATSPKYVDRVLAVSTTTGSGTLTLGAAVAGYQAWSALGDGISAYYYIEAVDGNGIPTGDWEVGIGTYTSSGTTLSRDTVLASSNSGSAVTLAAGTKRVGLTASPAIVHPYPVVETAMTADTTLTATAYGKAYLVTITSADITATLPAAANHTGETIRFRVAGSSTKLLTLDGNSTETLDGSLTRIMWAGESCEIMSDGTNWSKITGKTIPMVLKLTRASTDQSGIAASTWTAILMDTNSATSNAPAAMWDSGNNRGKAVRPGRYLVTVFVYESAGGSSFLYLGVSVNGAVPSPFSQWMVLASQTAGVCDDVKLLAVSDYVQPAVYGASTGTITIAGSASPACITLTELPQW